MTGAVVDTDPGGSDPREVLVSLFRGQAGWCTRLGSPIYGHMLERAADDLAAGGPVWRVVEPYVERPFNFAHHLRLMGAVHRLALAGEAPGLAAHYPSTGGDGDPDAAWRELLALHYPTVGGTPGDIWPVARRTVEEHLDALHELVQRPVQTNEVGRGSALLGGLVLIQQRTGLPIRLLEVGASGGLNLLVDRYAHEVADGVVLGDPASPVHLDQPWRGRHPAHRTPEILERRGCDPGPLDPTSAEDRLTLTSYVWADQVHRFERLRAALQVAAGDPPVVERSGAAAFLARQLAEPRPGVVTVVWHSVVRQYIDPAERRTMDELLHQAGARATSTAPLAHLALEPERGRSPRFLLSLRTWPGGRRRTLAECQGHGPPVVWRPSR